MRSRTLLRRLVAQRLMDALCLLPDSVELPADLALRRRHIGSVVDLFGLVVAEEALDVGLVIGTLNAGVLQRDVQNFCRLLKAANDELAARSTRSVSVCPSGTRVVSQFDG